ncbi:MAG: hypothetical protein RBR95_13145, partial [Ignavibacteriaceae bacterium]|nr:hypothetical protein [Ignavibacteriaceae bacterium]
MMHIICHFDTKKFNITDWIFFKKLYKNSFNNIIVTGVSDNSPLIKKITENYILDLSDFEFFDAVSYFIDMNKNIKDDEFVCICFPNLFFNHKEIVKELLEIDTDNNFLYSKILIDNSNNNDIYSIGNKQLIHSINNRIDIILNSEEPPTYSEDTLIFTTYGKLKECIKITDLNKPRFNFTDLFITMKSLYKPIESKYTSIYINKSQKIKINKKELLDQKLEKLKSERINFNTVITFEKNEIVSNETSWKILLQCLCNIRLNQIYIVGDYPFDTSIFKKYKNIFFIDRKKLTKDILKQTLISITSENSIDYTNL